MWAGQDTLINEVMQGKAHAQKKLYEIFASKMMAICYRYVPSTAEAEDILQEGFIKVFRHLHTFKNEGSLEGWIRRIMVNTALNHLKKTKRSFIEKNIDDAHDASIDAEALSLLHEREIFNHINELPVGYRTVINLYAIEGYSHKEIGALLNITESTSRSQYTRAKSLLKKRMDQFNLIPNEKSNAG